MWIPAYHDLSRLIFFLYLLWSHTFFVFHSDLQILPRAFTVSDLICPEEGSKGTFPHDTLFLELKMKQVWQPCSSLVSQPNGSRILDFFKPRFVVLLLYQFSNTLLIFHIFSSLHRSSAWSLTGSTKRCQSTPTTFSTGWHRTRLAGFGATTQPITLTNTHCFR